MKKLKVFCKYLALFTLSAVIFAVMSFVSSAKDFTVEKFTGYDSEWNDADFYVEYIPSYEFNGSEITPEYNVYFESGGEKILLTKGVDYGETVYGSLYPEPNNECRIYSLDGSGYSFGYTFLYEITFDASKLSVSDIPDQVYTGEEICPGVNVYYGSALLSHEFYEVDSYYCKNAGTASLYVGVDVGSDYYGIEKSFTIKPASAEMLTFGPIESVSYTGYSITPVLNITYNGYTLDDYDDYSVTYKNNINAGTATASVTFKGNFQGKKSIEFTINKVSASKLEYESIATQSYTGSKITPDIYVYTSEWKYLEQGKDFTVSYSKNINPGTASATVTFKNKNITGTKKLTFKIEVAQPSYMSSNVYGNSIELDWWSPGSDCHYQIYKYDSSKNKYVKIKTVKNSYYTDAGIKDYSTYKYKVRAYVKIDGKIYYSAYAEVTVKTQLLAPSSVKLTTKKGSVTVTWSKKTKATGYYVYRYNSSNGKTKRVYTAKKNTVLKYVDKSVKNYNSYTYWVVAYAVKGEKTTKSGKSVYAYSLDLDAITSGVKLKSKTSYKVYNVQGKKTTLNSTVKLSSADISTLKKFAKAHFKSGMTPEEKVWVTLEWIHSKVTYASSSKHWNKISGKSYVDAIFNYRLGQCVQYNGALAGMMTYLGYDVQLIKGYRHGSSQHYWVECKLNGLTYVMECGNKKDGAWYYYFTPYKYTSGYTKNGKDVSGYY